MEYDEHTAGFADGTLTPLAEDNSGEELISEFCMDFPDHNHDEALRILAWFDERLGGGGQKEGGRKFEMRFMAWLEDCLTKYKNYKDNQGSDPNLLRLSTDVFLLSLGFPHLAGADNPTELARRNGLSGRRILGQSGKQTACNMFHHFQKQLNLPPVVGQRSAEARKHMSESRKNQLDAD